MFMRKTKILELVRAKFGSTFLTALNSSTTIRIIMVNATENFSDYLAAHSASDGIIIPQNFSANYIGGASSERNSLW